jgi:hypothetical protein
VTVSLAARCPQDELRHRPVLRSTGGQWNSVQPHHVRQAAAEYDQLGPDEFLTRHGFGHARAYLLILDDKSYDSKAILGVAYGYATGRPLGPHDFSGGVHGAAGVLRALGFEIINIRDRGPSRPS